MYQSIQEIQAIIRATDIKIGFLFAFVMLPLTVLDKLLHFSILASSSSVVYFVIVIFISMLWASSLYMIFLAIAGISNPAETVKGWRPAGTYYLGDVFKLNRANVWMPKPPISVKTINDILMKLPKSESELINELLFEKLKVAYIRDVKLARFKACLILIIFWIVSGISVWIVYSLKDFASC